MQQAETQYILTPATHKRSSGELYWPYYMWAFWWCHCICTQPAIIALSQSNTNSAYCIPGVDEPTSRMERDTTTWHTEQCSARAAQQTAAVAGELRTGRRTVAARRRFHQAAHNCHFLRSSPGCSAVPWFVASSESLQLSTRRQTGFENNQSQGKFKAVNALQHFLNSEG